MKKIVCFALIFTILINVVGFGFLNVEASAEAVAATVAILSVIGGAVLGGCAGALGSSVTAKMDTIDQNIITRINEQAIQKGEMIQLVAERDLYGNYTDNTIYFVPVSNLPENERLFAEHLCQELNNSDSKRKIVQGYEELYSGTGGLPASIYSQLKTDAVNASLPYLFDYDNLSAYNELSGALENSGAVKYDFSFTGPIQEMTFATATGFVSNTIGDFRLLNAYIVPDNPNYFFDTEEQAHIYGATTFTSTSVDNNSRRVYTGFTSLPTNYGNGYYVIYNGEIYYRTNNSHVSSPAQGMIPVTVPSNNFDRFVSASGITLSDAGCTSLAGLSYGLYYCTDPNATTNYPVNVTQDDLIEETGGETIAYLPTSAEQGIKNAMAAGLLTPDSMLSISPEGDITGADGITIAQLQQMLDDLAEKLDIDIDLSTLEQYLQAIRIACSKSLTAEQLNTALNNVKSGIKDYSGSLGAILSAINGVKDLDQTQADKLTSIEEQTAAIAAAIAAVNEAELEVEKDDAEIDYYSVEHTGLAEAVAFVNEDQLVNQVKGLLNNILDPDKYSSGAPNFEFYYDSDKNGVAETYNAFDLSFLETPLTNANLKDKRHFTQPMTVRDFIQYLIILICYVGFALKVLRKLPSLFSGGESTAQDGLTMQAIESGKVLKSHIKGE